MTKEIIIIALILALIYLYYQKNKKVIGGLTHADQTLMSLLNSNSLEELQTKLSGKTLDELLEANEDYEAEVDTLTRTKNSLERDLLAQSNGFQNRLREKDRETKKLKEDLKSETQRADKTQEKLNSEKQISKGNIERITKLTEQITGLEKDLSQSRKTIEDSSSIIVGNKKSYEELQKKLNLKEQNIKDYKEQIKQLREDESTIINNYLNQKIKELQSEISSLNLQDSAQFNRSKSLKQIVKVLETLSEVKER